MGSTRCRLFNRGALAGQISPRLRSQASVIFAPMLTYLRYALATVCFAASVGCLALWWRSTTHFESVGGSVNGSTLLRVSAYCGRCNIRLTDFRPTHWRYKSEEFDAEFESINTLPPYFAASVSHDHRMRLQVKFPIWYPALVFALAGVAALRLGRRFTLRSALIATAVVAGLLGMAVGL